MRHLGLVLEVDGGGGDLEQLDPGLDGGGLRTVKAELNINAGFFLSNCRFGLLQCCCLELGC